MKILEINKFNFAKGGADKHFLDVVDLLKANGHEVAVFSMKHPKNIKSEWEKYFISTVGYVRGYSLWQKIKGIFRGFYSFEAEKKIKRLLDDFRPDIAHVHNIYHQLSPAILFQIKKRGIPIVMTVHDFKLINPNHNLFLRGEIYNRCQDGKYYQCLMDKCYKNSYLQSFGAMLEAYWQNTILKTYIRNVDLYIVPSEFVKNKLIEWKYPAKKVVVLPHFIPDNFVLTSKYIKECDTGEKYALYAGRISKEKGIDILANAFKNIPGIKLYLAGLVEDDVDINIIPNVRNLGFLRREELEKYMKKSEFVVSGSRLPETFGLIALEAISYGKPFLGFKTGAYPEIIKNHENGFLAKNEAELLDATSKICNAEIFFDGEEIKRNAHVKYCADEYCNNLVDLFDEAKN